MTGSIVGKRFYKKVMTREADDGSGWTVMLDYKTLKTPSKRPLKLPSLIVMKNYTIRDDTLSTFSLARRYKSMGRYFSVVHWFPDFSSTLRSCIFLFRISDVSYEERDDPDGRLERRGLSGDS
ncbi:hypothetical protein YC2023_065238 [Brassica napus]